MPIAGAHMPDDLHNDLVKFAEANHTNKSSVIRQAIAAYVRQ